jgi:hypothetical protein
VLAAYLILRSYAHAGEMDPQLPSLHVHDNPPAHDAQVASLADSESGPACSHGYEYAFDEHPLQSLPPARQVSAIPRAYDPTALLSAVPMRPTTHPLRH